MLLLLAAGCAWFQEPAPLLPGAARNPGGPPAGAAAVSSDTSAAVVRAGLFSTRGDSSGSRPPGDVATAFPHGPGVAADTTRAGRGGSAAADSAGAWPASTPADSVTALSPSAPADTAEARAVASAVADSVSSEEVPASVLRGNDLWTLTGDSLAAATGPRGQVVHIVRPYITQGELTIVAPTGKYFVDARRAELTGGVSFTEGDTRGSSTTAEYDRTRRVLTAHDDVVVTDESDSLRLESNEARYDRDADEVFFSGSVHGRKGRRRLAAREAQWRRGRREVILRGGVRVTDPDEESTVTGDRLRYDLDRDQAEVTRNPRLKLRGGNGFPIWITGEKLWVEPDGDAFGSGDVRVVRRGVVATADSAAFFHETGDALLLGSPLVTEREGTLRGDTLILRFDEDRVLIRADVHGNAAVRYEPADSTRAGEISRVRGDSLSMYFRDGEADRVVVFGRAFSSYVPAHSDSSSGVGTNTARGDTITIFLEDGEVDRVRITGSVKGVYAFGSYAVGREDEEALSDSAAVAASDSARVERVVYRGDTAVFTMSDRVVDLFGNTEVQYGALNLTAGKVRFYTGRRYVEAEENPVLVEHQAAGGDRRVVGARMDYNLDTREGTIEDGRTRAEDGFIYSERLRRIGEDAFLARQGSYTTCDNIERDKPPHYHFTSKRMGIYLKDKVVAKPVVLYIRNIPVFALPFYVFSINKGRRSGFLTPDLDFGLGGSSGRYFRNLGYYWAASDYYDFTVSADYTERPSRFVGTLRTRYKKRYLMEGDLTVRRTLGSGESQHDIVGAHSMTLGEWALKARAEFRSAEFRRQDALGTDFGHRLDRQLKSDISLSRRFSGASVFLKASRQKNLGTDPRDGRDELILQEMFPSYSLALQSRSIGRLPDRNGEGGRLPFLASTRVSFSSRGFSSRTQREKTTILGGGGSPPDTLFGIEDERTSSARHTLGVSDSRRIWNAFNVGPSFQVTENWVDREFSAGDTTKGFRRAATWNASLQASTTLYGTFRGLGPVKALRHTFQPSVSFSYQPEFRGLSYRDTAGVRHNRFPGISSFERQSLNLSVRNGLQAKVRSGDEIRRVNVLNWSLNGRYDFLAAKEGRHGWSDVGSSLDLSRVLGVDLSFNSTHDPYRRMRFQNYQLRAIFSLGGNFGGPGAAGTEEPYPAVGGGDWGTSESWNDRGADLGYGALESVGSGTGSAARPLSWNASFSVSHSGMRMGEKVETTTLVNGHLSMQVTRNWSLSYEGNWDVTAGKLAGEWLTLKRDLHCWEAMFTRSKLGSDTTFYFRINVKSLPDVKYEQGRRGGSGFGSLTRMLP